MAGRSASGTGRRQAPRGAIPRDRLEELIAGDLSVRQIAAEVDRSPTTVRHWLERYGLRASEDARRRRGARARQSDDAADVCPVHGAARVRCISPRCRSEAVTAWRRRAKRTLVAEAGGRCALCGYDRSVAALHFHHRDPANKAFTIGGRGLARALDVLRSEAAKCVLLCANCHAEVEAGVTDLAGANIRAASCR